LDFVGFGHFSSQFALGMLMRDSNPTSPTVGQIRIYDIILQDPTTGKYTAESPNSNIIISGTTQLGVDWKPVGIAPMSGVSSSDDLIMRQDGTGAMLVYDIRDDKIVPGGTTFLPANSVPATYQPAIGGDFLSPPSGGSTSQLVQAMAGFGGDSGATAGLNAAPLGADTSQPQSLLTTAQHA